MTVFYNSLWESVAPMVMVVFALLMMTVFFSSLMFIFEKGNAIWNHRAQGYVDPVTGKITEVSLVGLQNLLPSGLAWLYFLSSPLDLQLIQALALSSRAFLQQCGGVLPL